MAVPSAIRWSFGLGSWWGVPVRLHLFLVLFCVALVSMTLAAMPAEALLTLAVILISLLLHEAAHALAAVKLGGVSFTKKMDFNPFPANIFPKWFIGALILILDRKSVV